jgi:hypothetical protein
VPHSNSSLVGESDSRERRVAKEEEMVTESKVVRGDDRLVSAVVMAPQNRC